MSVEKILPLERAVEIVDELKRRGKRVVFTNGCFDLIHDGHIHCLAEAKKLGDVLVVAVNSDASVRDLKGPTRPIFPAYERAELLAALESVDYVTIFDDRTPRAIITRMLPDVLVKGSTWAPSEIIGRAEVEAAGGKVVRIAMVERYNELEQRAAPLSSSSLIQEFLKNYNRPR